MLCRTFACVVCAAPDNSLTANITVTLRLFIAGASLYPPSLSQIVIQSGTAGVCVSVFGERVCVLFA